MILNKRQHNELLVDLFELIESSREKVVAQINSSISVLFWNVGSRILSYTLNHKRADYGKQIVVALSRELVRKYGRNFEEKNLRRMIQFAREYPD